MAVPCYTKNRHVVLSDLNPACFSTPTVCKRTPDAKDVYAYSDARRK